MTTQHPRADVVDVPQDVVSLFALLDEVVRGLAREAALTPDERAARAEPILAWFAPREAAIQAAAAAAPARSGGPCTPPIGPPTCRILSPIRARTASLSDTGRGRDHAARGAAPHQADAAASLPDRGSRRDGSPGSRSFRAASGSLHPAPGG
jgi:hypothetical protein